MWQQQKLWGVSFVCSFSNQRLNYLLVTLTKSYLKKLKWIPMLSHEAEVLATLSPHPSRCLQLQAFWQTCIWNLVRCAPAFQSMVMKLESFPQGEKKKASVWQQDISSLLPVLNIGKLTVPQMFPRGNFLAKHCLYWWGPLEHSCFSPAAI